MELVPQSHVVSSVIGKKSVQQIKRGRIMLKDLASEDSHIVGSISSGGKTIVNKEDDPKSLFVKLLYNCPYIKKGKCQVTKPQQCCFSCEGNQKCYEGRWEDLEHKRCQKGFFRCYRYHQWGEENG